MRDHHTVDDTLVADVTHGETHGDGTSTAQADSDRLRKERGAFFTPPTPDG